MIVLAGVPAEPPLALVRSRLEEIGAPVTVVDQRSWQDSAIEAEVAGGSIRGWLRTPTQTIRLESVRGIMTRLMNDQLLPDLAAEPPGSTKRARCRAFHAALGEWIDLAPGRVLNRSRPQLSNASKPYQAQRIRACGLSVPATLITNQPAEVRSFVARHGRVVYKSASGVRSIVTELLESDLDRLELIRWCPVQFQEYVAGRDVRVHVVGPEVFATAVDSDGIDYRYAGRQGGTTTLAATTLSAETADACRALAEALLLPLAGIDLRLAPDGRIVCFEVNPSPGYSYYEDHTGQPISAAIARYLLAG